MQPTATLALRKFVQSIWSRWYKDYLHQLEQRNKWQTPNGNLAEDDVVIIIEDNAPPLHWSLGVVTKIFMGDDQLVRVVDVRTPRGILRRPIHKLCALPVSNE